MTRYEIDVAGVAGKTSAVSLSVSEVEHAVTSALAGADAVEGSLGSLGGVLSAFSAVAEDRRETGQGMTAYARGVIAAAQQGALAFVQGDEDMAATTDASSAATDVPATGGER